MYYSEFPQVEETNEHYDYSEFKPTNFLEEVETLKSLPEQDADEAYMDEYE